MLLKPSKERPGVVGLVISFIPEILIVLAIVGAVVGKKAFSDQYVTTIFTQNFFEKEVLMVQSQIRAATEIGQPAPEIKSIHALLDILQSPVAKKIELKQPIDVQNAKAFLLSFDKVYATKDQVIKAHRQIDAIDKNDPQKFIPIAEETYHRLKKVYDGNKTFFGSLPNNL